MRQGVAPGYGSRGRRRELVVSAARAWRCVKARRGELRAAWCGARQARAGVSRAWSWLANRRLKQIVVRSRFYV